MSIARIIVGGACWAKCGRVQMKRSNGYGRCDDIGLAHDQAKEQPIKTPLGWFDIENRNKNQVWRTLGTDLVTLR
jgi:hypothetical protein